MTTFEEMYAVHHDAIVHFCFVEVRSREVAEDLMQEAFFSVWKAFPHLEGQEEGALKAYLYRTAQNKIIDYTRHKHLIEWCELDDESVVVEGDFTVCIEQRECIMQILDTLTPFYRETLLDWLYDKRAIAHATGFKMVASRARKSFQKEYQEQEARYAVS